MPMSYPGLSGTSASIPTPQTLLLGAWLAYVTPHDLTEPRDDTSRDDVGKPPEKLGTANRSDLLLDCNDLRIL